MHLTAINKLIWWWWWWRRWWRRRRRRWWWWWWLMIMVFRFCRVIFIEKDYLKTPTFSHFSLHILQIISSLVVVAFAFMQADHIRGIHEIHSRRVIRSDATILTSSTGSRSSLMQIAERSALARRSRAHQLRAERYCASLLAGESSEVHGRLFRKSSAVDNYAQPVDDTSPCYRVTGWARSGLFGSTVLIRGTVYRIVSVSVI